LSVSLKMGGKAKPAHHTARELQAKADLHKPRGGGQAGKAERLPVVAFTCMVCKVGIPREDALLVHYTNKHPKETLNMTAYETQKREAAERIAAKAKEGFKFTGTNGPSTL